MRTKLTIVSLFGAGVLLLAVLSAISAPRAQIAYAQTGDPTITIVFSSFVNDGTRDGQMKQGDQLFAQYTFGNIQSVTCEADLSFINFGNQHACFHRSEVYPRNADTTNPANRVEQCEGSDFGHDRSFSPRTGNSRVIDFSQNQVSPDCPVGEYTLKVILMGSTGDDNPDTTAPFLKPVAATNTKDFRVVAGSATATPTNTRQPQPPPAHTPTPTPTLDPNLPTLTPTATPTPTLDPNLPTLTPTATSTRDPNLPTLTPTATSTRDPNLPTLTPTATSTRDPNLPTLTPTATSTRDPNLPTLTPTATSTRDPNLPTLTPTATSTRDPNLPTLTPTATPTRDPNLPTLTPTATSTRDPNLPTLTPTATSTRDLNLPTLTPTATATRDLNLPTLTPTATSTRDLNLPTLTPTATPTVTSTRDPQLPTPTPTPTATATRDPNLPTLTPTATSTRDPNLPTLTPTATLTVDGDGGKGNGGQGNGGQGNGGQGSGNQGNNQVKSYVGDFMPQSSQQQSQRPIAITLPAELNVRNGPALECDIVATVPAGTRAFIIGLDPDDDWYQVEIEGIVGQAWIYQDLTTLVGSLAGVKRYTALEIAQITGIPATATDGSVPLAITVPITMNVRIGPGLTYDVVRVVPKGTQGRIFGIDPDNDWFQIELEGLDTLVWVYQDLTTVVGSLAGVKRVTEEELALLPAAITQPALLNARAGPGLTYDILTTIPQGTWTKITAIDTQGDWYRVELDDLDQPVWIYRDFTKVAGGSLEGLIQITVKDPPPSTVEQLTGSITVDLALPQAGRVDLEVSWLDAIACAQLYSLYHRASTHTTVYISLNHAATASTPNAKSLSFSTLTGSSFISAWCGTNAAGREVAEVEIDPGVAGTYSSTTTSGGLAAVPPRSTDNPH